MVKYLVKYEINETKSLVYCLLLNMVSVAHSGFCFGSYSIDTGEWEVWEYGKTCLIASSQHLLLTSTFTFTSYYNF